MLHHFVTTNRDAILTRTHDKLSSRPWGSASADGLEHGIPLFLSQLSDTLERETSATPFSPNSIGASAARHGGELLALGFDVSQVVHAYGDICQAVTELAVEQGAPITVEEFHTLNRCLDTAIAEAVTEHARITAQSRSNQETERLGQLTHEIRDMLNTAIIAFEILKRGTVGSGGSTGRVLGRSLMGLRDLVDSTLSDVRLTASHQRRERIAVSAFLHDLGVAAAMHAEYRGLQFDMDLVTPGLTVDIDPQLLASAVTNLLSNAFKYTPAGGRVVLRAHDDGARLRIEVEDECGGLPQIEGDRFQPFGDRRGNDRTGLGLGLSIARKAVRAHEGDISIRNLPGKGCVFVIDVPLAPEPLPELAAVGS